MAAPLHLGACTENPKEPNLNPTFGPWSSFGPVVLHNALSPVPGAAVTGDLRHCRPRDGDSERCMAETKTNAYICHRG